MTQQWNTAQGWESEWWGNCCNTLNEEIKQREYARLMGLRLIPTDSGYSYDLAGRSVIDIGGGPVSLLLKCINLSHGAVIDPCKYPEWITARYNAAGITYLSIPGESYALDKLHPYDEVWIYNVLQHVNDPELVITRAKKLGKLLRIFEWINTEQNVGHPHILTPERLNAAIGGIGATVTLSGSNECYGTAYFGVFSF